MSNLNRPELRNTLINRAMDCGTERGTEHDAEHGTERGTDHGTEHDAELGADHGTERGMERGTERGMERGWSTSNMLFNIYLAITHEVNAEHSKYVGGLTGDEGTTTLFEGLPEPWNSADRIFTRMPDSPLPGSREIAEWVSIGPGRLTIVQKRRADKSPVLKFSMCLAGELPSAYVQRLFVRRYSDVISETQYGGAGLMTTRRAVGAPAGDYLDRRQIDDLSGILAEVDREATTMVRQLQPCGMLYLLSFAAFALRGMYQAPAVLEPDTYVWLVKAQPRESDAAGAVVKKVATTLELAHELGTRIWAAEPDAYAKIWVEQIALDDNPLSVDFGTVDVRRP